MPRPLIATVSISALQHNLHIAKSHAHAHQFITKVWAVVKANAYGHGLACAVRGFARADGLALIEPDYAMHLRELGWIKPILLLEGFFDAADVALIVEAQLEFAVHNDQQLTLLERVLPTLAIKSPLTVHLKMNSGMNRLGFKPTAYRAAYQRLRALPAIGNIVLMTHLANADDPQNSGLPVKSQHALFEASAAGLDGERSIANSAAVLMRPELHANWIRPGIMLYGASPVGSAALSFGLHPAMTLSSEIIGIQHLIKGEVVGYGSRFIANQAMTIGIVACGYADGYPRHAPTGTPVIVDGVRTGTIGSISMDMFSVDLSHVPHAHVGSKVVLWGEDLSVDEVALASETIGYELLCAVAPRVHREVKE